MFGLDLFFPSGIKCIFCGRETKDYGICEDCYKALPLITGETCIHCGGKIMGMGLSCLECKNKQFAIDRNYAVMEYRGDIRHAMSSFKEGGKKYFGYAFARLLEDKFKGIDEQVDLIVPVPIGSGRLKTRGYNQSEILCKELISTGKVRTDILLRPNDTLHQTGLDRKHRIANLKGVFKVSDKKLIEGKCILVVDDIYTTGSTLNECATTLKRAGARRVIGLTLCRTPINIDNILK